MSIIRRAARQQNFTVVPNEIIDSGLSWSATGILIYLLSKPDNWKVRRSQLVNLKRGAGDNALRTIFEELEGAGYMVRRQTRDQSGKLGHETIVYDTPQGKSPGQTTRWISTSGSSTSGSSTCGSPAPLVSTEVVSTDVPSTEVEDLSSRPVVADGEQLSLIESIPTHGSAAASSSKRDSDVVDESDYTDDFKTAWAAYPRKKGVNKKAAFRVWRATLNRKAATPEELIEATRNYAKHAKRQGLKDHYMKLPATFYGRDEHWRVYLHGVPNVGPADRRFNVVEHDPESESGEISLEEALGLT